MMIANQQTRLDPSTVDREELDRLVAAFSEPGHVAVIDSKSHRTEIPEPIYQHLMRIIRIMREGQAVVMIPEAETFTTQAAANFLGVSRQFLVNLIESKQIPAFKVGSHRRIYFKDLLTYQQKRDSERSRVLDSLRDEIDEAGLYFPQD